MRSAAALIALIFLWGCDTLPDLPTPSEAARAADYPRLGPIDDALRVASAPVRVNRERDAVQTRVQRLRRRAAIMRGAVVDDATRARIARVGGQPI